MDTEALPQRSASGRRSRTQDIRPSKVAKNTRQDTEQAEPIRNADLPEYRSSAEQDQQFECELMHLSQLT